MKENNSEEKDDALEKLSRQLKIEEMNENELGQLSGGFSEPTSAEEDEETIHVNWSKCGYHKV
ncbi:hypothetical protein [Chryseobacterium taichungense]|uniref:hypothetical protein n=1 Tax=Chryseobacterium taichungense TaxID=295069 RepID=UPI0028AB7C39|nr:hypothetical protein [Chryseobacterium taichungense]